MQKCGPEGPKGGTVPPLRTCSKLNSARITQQASSKKFENFFPLFSLFSRAIPPIFVPRGPIFVIVKILNGTHKFNLDLIKPPSLTIYFPQLSHLSLSLSFSFSFSSSSPLSSPLHSSVSYIPFTLKITRRSHTLSTSDCNRPNTIRAADLPRKTPVAFTTTPKPPKSSDLTSLVISYSPSTPTSCQPSTSWSLSLPIQPTPRPKTKNLSRCSMSYWEN